jgi:hypothetical protein
MNMSRSRIVESPEGYFMSYRREYSIIKICIKDITNLVNPRSIVNQTEPEKKGIGKKNQCYYYCFSLYHFLPFYYFC